MLDRPGTKVLLRSVAGCCVVAALTTLAPALGTPPFSDPSAPKPPAGVPAVPSTASAPASSAQRLLAYSTLARRAVEEWGRPVASPNTGANTGPNTGPITGLNTGPGDAAPPDVQPPTAIGAAVVLRFDRQIIGRSAVLTLHAGAAAPGIPRDADPARAALSGAIAEALRRLAVNVSGLSPEARADKLHEAAGGVTISVELASGVEPLADATYADIDASVPLGLAGVAAAFAGPPGGPQAGQDARPDASAVQAVFPSAMLASGITPSDALRRAVTMLTGRGELALLEPAELRAKHGLVFYRFKVDHAAEPEPGRPAEVLYRGQRLITLGDVDQRRELSIMAMTLADHLRRRHRGGYPISSAALALEGDRPAGTSDERPVSLTQAAGLVVALEAYEALATIVEADVRTPTVTSKGRLAQELRVPLTREVLAAMDRAALPNRAELHADAQSGQAQLAAALLAHDDKPLRATLEALTASIPQGRAPALGGLLAWSLQDPARVRAAMADRTPGTLVNDMPWLGWAELDSAAKGEPVPSAAALRQMRASLWQLQLTALDAGDDGQDLVGGLVFPGSRAALPTWQTARAVAFLATMLGDDRLTSPSERPEQIAKLIGAVRYLRQLQVDRTLTWMVSEPSFAIGGVRASTLDQTVSMDATSMTLLAVLELLRSLDTLERVTTPAPAPAPTPAPTPAPIPR